MFHWKKRGLDAKHVKIWFYVKLYIDIQLLRSTGLRLSQNIKTPVMFLSVHEVTWPMEQIVIKIYLG